MTFKQDPSPVWGMQLIFFSGTKNRVTWSESDRVCRSCKCFHLLPAVPLTHDPSVFLSFPFPFSFPLFLFPFSHPSSAFLSFSFFLSFFLSLAPLRKAKFVESPRIPESELGSPTLTSAQKLDVDAYCPGKHACSVCFEKGRIAAGPPGRAALHV